MIHYCVNLFYCQNLIKLNIIFKKFQKLSLSCNIFNVLCKSKFDSFCVDRSVQPPKAIIFPIFFYLRLF